MGVADIFVETINKIKSIKKVDNVVPNPVKTGNFSKTASNVNDVFKYINIWDNQIDEMIAANSYSFKTNESAIFIELRLGRCAQLLNKVSTYPEAVIVFHVFSQVFDGGNDTMERNVEIYRYRDVIKSKITGWSPSSCSNFMCFDDALDYKHGNITKYLIGFNFNFTDLTGSIFDVNSPNYLKFVTQSGATLGSVSFFTDWISGLEYTSQISVVANGYTNKVPNIYLCTTNNNDVIFDNSKWYQIFAWVSNKQYTVDDKVYLFNRVYNCVEDNNDSIFNPSKWEIIT